MRCRRADGGGPLIDVEARKIWDARLPENVTIRSIRNGNIYGTHRDEYGVQEVVVYRIAEPV
jgi:hypothetical protein